MMIGGKNHIHGDYYTYGGGAGDNLAFYTFYQCPL